jgi:hypothetical protein
MSSLHFTAGPEVGGRDSSMSGNKKDRPSDDDLNAWAKSIEPSVGCKTCSHAAAAETTRRLLRAMARNKATHITLRQLHRKVCQLHEDYLVGYWGFRAHLYDHERDLYDKARGAL